MSAHRRYRTGRLKQSKNSAGGCVSALITKSANTTQIQTIRRIIK